MRMRNPFTPGGSKLMKHATCNIQVRVPGQAYGSHWDADKQDGLQLHYMRVTVVDGTI